MIAQRVRLVVAITAAAVLVPLVVTTPASAGEVIDGRFPTEESFVDQAYRDFLQRGPDAAGLNFWADEIRRGVPAEELVEQLLVSEEFQGTIAPIVRLYSSVFDRQPDLAGLRFWISKRREGTPLPVLADAFLASAEFDELAAANSTDEVVAAIYGRSLGREPDAAGLAFWIGEIDSGKLTLGEFVAIVSESPENQVRQFSTVIATLMYLGVLQRTPEEDGLVYWAAQIDDGLAIDSFAGTVMGLAEYRARFAERPMIATEVVATGLTIPWDVESLPDGTVILTERPGGLHVIPPGGSVRELAADLGDLWANGETGMLGLAVDPAFEDNRRIYTCQGHTSPREIQVIAWTLDAGLTTATRVVDPLVSGIPVSTGRHGGCQLEFDAEGNLYIGTGDAAVGSLPQNLTSLGGKVLRVDPATGNAASGNPFEGSTNANQRLIYTYGHRNVQGLGLRPGTNEMWSVEHGPSVNDEVNRLTVPGGNAGWNPVPGYNEAVSMTNFGLGGTVFGAAWATGGSTLALSGGDWTSSPAWGAWDGALGVAALKNQTLRLLFFNDEGLYLGQRTILDGEFGRLRAVHQSSDGSLYVSTSTGNDRVIRITPS